MQVVQTMPRPKRTNLVPGAILSEPSLSALPQPHREVFLAVGTVGRHPLQPLVLGTSTVDIINRHKQKALAVAMGSRYRQQIKKNYTGSSK